MTFNHIFTKGSSLEIQTKVHLIYGAVFDLAVIGTVK